MKKLTIILFVIISFTTYAQKKDPFKNFALDGHLQDLQMVWIEKVKNPWNTLNTVSNRFDLKWYPSNSFTAHVGMRNIMNYGMLIEEYYPSYHNALVKDDGYVNMTKSLANDSSFFAYTTLDRAYLQYTKGNFSATIGRQRINWGINLVWTPNDIFNSFNYFDFDYIERPGCDAVLLQYYTGSTSSVQGAVKVDNNNKITAAGLVKFMKWNYDFQFLGGVMTDDLVLGMGWSGQIKGAGFNGEMTYFHSHENFSDSTGLLVASAGINYTANKWYFQLSGLLNTNGTNGPASMGSYMNFNQNINAKNFTRARYSSFGQVSYQISPIIKADASVIFNPGDKSLYIGPSLDFSLTENIGLLLMSQIFTGNKGTEFGDYGSMFYMRLKWSF